MRFVSLSAQRVRFVGFARLAACFSLWLFEGAQCVDAQRLSVRWAARLISVYVAFLFGTQRVRFGVSEGWQRVSFR